MRYRQQQASRLRVKNKVCRVLLPMLAGKNFRCGLYRLDFHQGSSRPYRSQRRFASEGSLPSGMIHHFPGSARNKRSPSPTLVPVPTGHIVERDRNAAGQ